MVFGGGKRVQDPAVFESALREGFRAIDTATSYGNDHKILASELARRLVKEDRTAITVYHKFEAQSHMEFEKICDRALANLGLAYLDVVMLHDPFSFHLQAVADPRREAINDKRFSKKTLRAAWSALERLVEAGKVKRIGLSNAGEAVMDAIFETCKVAPSFDEIEVHPYCQQTRLRKYCKDHGVQVLAFCPLGSPWRTGNTELHDETILRIARKHGVSAPDVCLKWSIQNGCMPIVSAKTPEKMRSNLVLGGKTWGLDDDDLAAIHDLERDFRIHRSPFNIAGVYGGCLKRQVVVPRKPTSTQGMQHAFCKQMYLHVTPSYRLNQFISWFIWQFFFNWMATLEHLVALALSAFRLSKTQKRVLRELNKQGWSVCTFDEIYGDVADAEAFRSLQDHAPYNSSFAEPQGVKRITKDDMIWRLGTSRRATAIVDRYMGLASKLDWCRIFTREPATRPPAITQNWHVDQEDYYGVKVYIYLSDVDDYSGPLEYFSGTHPKGQWSAEVAQLCAETFVSDGSDDPHYPKFDCQVENGTIFKHVRADLWRQFTGKAGTVVFFDTRGLHRGGHALGSSRKVCYFSYTAPVCIHKLWNRSQPMFRFVGERATLHDRWRAWCLPSTWHHRLKLKPRRAHV